VYELFNISKLDRFVYGFNQDFTDFKRIFWALH